MRHIVKLKQILINPQGEPYPDEQSSAGYLLRDILGSMSKGSGVEKVEAYRLCLALKNVDEIDLEEADAKLCEKAVADAPNLPAVAYVQLMDVLKGVQPEPKPVEQPQATPVEQPKAEPTQTMPVDPVQA